MRPTVSAIDLESLREVATTVLEFIHEVCSWVLNVPKNRGLLTDVAGTDVYDAPMPNRADVDITSPRKGQQMQRRVPLHQRPRAQAE